MGACHGKEEKKKKRGKENSLATFSLNT